MKLHNIEIENWRTHTQKSLDFDKKTTVIYGPNESGKSTILEALCRGFFDRSKSNARQIKRITPFLAVGSLASKVLITFSLGDQKYEITKSFNHNKSAELSRIQNGKKIPIAQDDDADRKLLEMIEADISTGASDPSKWGAFYWLWIPQDTRGLPDKGDTTSYLHLDQKGNTALVTPVYQSVQGFVNSKYLDYFTDKGKARKNSPVATLDVEIQNQKDVLTALNKRYNQVQEYQNEINEIQNQITPLTKQIELTGNELESAKHNITELGLYEKSLQNIQSKLRETEHNFKDAEDAINQLCDIAKKIQETQLKENKAIDDRSKLEAIGDLLKKQVTELDAKTIDQQSHVNECEELTKDARIQYTILKYEEQLGNLQEKVGNISKIENQIKEIRAKIKTTIITKKELEKLTEDEIKISTLTKGLSDVGLNVIVSPGKKGTLNVNVDGKKLEKTITETTGTNEIIVYAEDFGRVTIHADIEKAKKIKVEIEQRQNEITQAIARDSVSNLEELKELFNEQEKFTRDVEGLQKQRDYVDKRPLDVLVAESININKKIGVYKNESRSKTAIQLNPVNHNLGKLINQRESELEDTKKVLNDLQENREVKRKEHEEKNLDAVRARTQAQSLQDKRMGLIDEERRLIEKFGNAKSQKEIFNREKETLLSQKDEEKSILCKMDELEAPLIHMRTLETKLKNEKELLKQKTSRSDQLLGSIRVDSLQGVYSGISEGESRLEALMERHKRLTRDSEILKILKNLLEAEYQEALDSVSAPIKKDVAEYLAYVTGNLHDEVELNDMLIPVRMGQRGIDELALEFEDGSSGLKEALTLCVRLAVAKHLSENDSQSLVLDDPFIHMSKNRSERMIDLFNRLVNENNLQIIILTHRELEFTGLDGTMVNIQD